MKKKEKEKTKEEEEREKRTQEAKEGGRCNLFSEG